MVFLLILRTYIKPHGWVKYCNQGTREFMTHVFNSGCFTQNAGFAQCAASYLRQSPLSHSLTMRLNSATLGIASYSFLTKCYYKH